jgi:hypothetical protein
MYWKMTRGNRLDRMVVGFTTTYNINAYIHWSGEFNSRSWRGVLYTTLCAKICQWLATGRRFSPGTPVSSTSKTDRCEITEILLKVVLNTIIITVTMSQFYVIYHLFSSISKTSIKVPNLNYKYKEKPFTDRYAIKDNHIFQASYEIVTYWPEWLG